MAEQERTFWDVKKGRGDFVREKLMETTDMAGGDEQSFRVLTRIKKPATLLFVRVLDLAEGSESLRSLKKIEPDLCQELVKEVDALLADGDNWRYREQLECLKDLMEATGIKEIERINERAIQNAWKMYQKNDGADILLVMGMPYAQNPDSDSDIAKNVCAELDVRMYRPIENPRLMQEAARIRQETHIIYGKSATKVTGLMLVEYMGGAGWQLASPTNAEQLYDGKSMVLMLALNLFKSIPTIKEVFETAGMTISDEEIEFWLGLIMVAHEDGHAYQWKNYRPVELVEAFTDMGSMLWRLLGYKLEPEDMQKLVLVMYGEFVHALRYKPNGKANEDAYYYSAILGLEYLLQMVKLEEGAFVVDVSVETIEKVRKEAWQDHLMITGRRRERGRMINEIMRIVQDVENRTSLRVA